MNAKRAWRRINIVVGYPFLLVIDLAIAGVGQQGFREAHGETRKRLKAMWNR